MILRSLPAVRAFLALLALAASAGTAVADESVPAPAANDGVRPGLLGRHHLSLSYDFYQLSDPGPFDSSANGMTIAGNFRLARPLDLNLRYSTATVGGPLGIDLERTEFIGALTLHREFRPGDSAFIRLGFGTVSEEVVVRQSGGATELALGLEFLVRENLVLTPAFDYLASSDLDIHEMRFGITADWRLGRHWSALVRVRHVSVRDDTDYQQYSVGLGAKF